MLHVLVPLFLAWRDQRSRPPSAAGIALPVAQLHAIRYPNTLPRPPSSSLAVSRRLFAHCLDSGETPHARCTLPPLLSPTASQRLLPTAPPASPPRVSQPSQFFDPPPASPVLAPRSSRVSGGTAHSHIRRSTVASIGSTSASEVGFFNFTEHTDPEAELL